jgi:hypothetical protein
MSNDVPLLVSDPPPLIIFSSHVDRLRSLIVVVSIPPEFSSGITLRLKSETSGREGEPTICRRLVNILRHLINLASVCLGSCSQKQIAGVTYRLLGWYIYIAHMLIRIYLFWHVVSIASQISRLYERRRTLPCGEKLDNIDWNDLSTVGHRYVDEARNNSFDKCLSFLAGIYQNVNYANAI